MEIHNALNKYSSSSTFSPDHISWSHLKKVSRDPEYITNIVNIANTCIVMNFKSLGLDEKTILVLSNTRELNRDPFYKVVYLIYYYQWSMLTTVHPTLIDHM